MKRAWTRKKQFGFTLIELLTILVIIGILFLIAVPIVSIVISNTRADVCFANQKELERFYENQLDLESKVHSTELFLEASRLFDNDICPEGGVITYESGDCTVNCSKHYIQESDEEGEVPFL